MTTSNKVSVSVNVPAARAEFERVYQITRTGLAIEGDFNYMAKAEDIRYRLNVPLPCGCLMRIDDEEKFEKSGWSQDYDCEHHTWHVERQHGAGLKAVKVETGRETWKTRSQLI